MASEFLDADALRAAASLRYVELHDTLGSTNDRAVELARDLNAELPALIATRFQMAGRGRGSNTWVAADGALTFSLVLEPTALGVATANWPLLSLASAVAVGDALDHEFGSENNATDTPRTAIKWPNDVYVAQRKIAGILIESPGGATAKARIVVGIGVNVNNSQSGSPDRIAVCDVSNRTHDLQALLSSIVCALFARFRQIATGDRTLVAAWQQSDMLAGQNIVVEAADRRIEGRCVAIADDGALLLETSHGIQRICSGSIRFADKRA